MVAFKGAAQFSRGKKVPTDDGRGIKWIADGIDKADIVLEIDVQALLARLGPEAIRNKSGKSCLAGGLIVARASNVRRVA